MRALRGAAAGFFLFFIVGIVLAWPALRWPMVYDDLHLLRTFAPEERSRAGWGSWDPDGIEHPGLRPLTLLFNEARYRVFGENVAAHRLFLLVLFAGYASLLVRAACSLGVPEPAAVAAGVLLLCSRYSVYHYTWLTDGNHLLQGLLFALAALCLLRGLRGPAWPWRAISVAAFAGAVLVREDSLALGPVLLLFGFVAAPQWRALRGFAFALLAVSLALFLCRSLAVPAAPPPGLDVKGFLVAAGRALNLVGPESFDGISRVLALTGDAAPVLVVAILLFRRRRIDARTPLLFLAASVLACTPALTFRRDDMLFFPVSFAALFYGSALWTLARDLPAFRAVAAMLFASSVLGGAYVSRAFALNFHPDSARAIRWNAQMLYGLYADRATIPSERRAALVRQLAAQGVASAADLAALGSRIGVARAEGPFRPGRPGTLFFPPLSERDF
jgi:hypothetical protein